MSHTQQNNPYKVAISSMIGTAIEFYDYYIYAAAAVLVFSTQFFDKSDPTVATLLSLSTLALAFFARPLGSLLFGYFGDKIGRKKTLVASLLTMGISTIAIGLLPTYAQIGIWAPILLCIFRVGQGIGLGGEWGGAALVAVENAPANRRAWFGTFPQLGAPIGLFVANAVFFIISAIIGHEALIEWGWRIPFIASFLLVAVGLWMRLSLHESHVFEAAKKAGKTKGDPISGVLKNHWQQILQGTLMMTTMYVLFYIMTAFAQVYSKSPVAFSDAGHQTGLGIAANTYTGFLLIGAVIFGIFVSISGVYSDRIGRRRLQLITMALLVVFGLAMPSFLVNGTPTSVLAFLVVGFTLMGFAFGPVAAILPEIFPTQVRYTGASLTYNLAAITGASVVSIVAIEINQFYGMTGVGLYLSVNAILSFIAYWFAKETKNVDLTQ
ncbi:metabolite/H+ symporter [Moraxella nasovis]|uniref:metabolite/H+ symporter n=1 Tax=Moraxella nasovis TaxID=2904121 RepID=UPI001F60DE21|nr:metabolite/H+ symporter [Moraxella nasovis]UNU73879.1 metabolite/H+ symporter [Moraxella nasovis]